MGGAASEASAEAWRRRAQALRGGSDLNAEAAAWSALLALQDDTQARERLAAVLGVLGRHAEAASHLRMLVQAAPRKLKLRRALARSLRQTGDFDAVAELWRETLVWQAELETRDPAAGAAAAADLAVRLFPELAELVQTISPLDPDGIADRWRLVRSLYSDPRFAALAARFPAAFGDFVRVAGEDLVLKAAGKHGADLSPVVDDALALFLPSASRTALLTAARTQIAGDHGGLAEIQAKARRLLDHPRFHAPVIVCGFHHSGTRLLARLLAAIGVTQRINAFQFEWSYVIQLNSILEPGCLDPARLDPARRGVGAAGDAGIVAPERLALRMAMAGLEPGATWGFKDPRNGLTLGAWLGAFKEARVVNIVRDPVAVLGTLPEVYGQLVRTDARRPTATAFWMALWEGYLMRTRQAMGDARAAVEVRFEDLCRDPSGTLNRIVQALDLDLPVDPSLIQEVAIEPGKTDLRDQLRARGGLARSELEALEALAARHGYPGNV